MSARAMFFSASGDVLWSSDDPDVVRDAERHGVHLDDHLAEQRADELLLSNPVISAGLGLAEGAGPSADDGREDDLDREHLSAEERANRIEAALGRSWPGGSAR